jgi:glycosyltransferase involved in cell wall biosynthesis
MKILFSHPMPFFLAHGGMQTLIEAMMLELRVLGAEVEPERWWDDTQTGDVIHYFGRPVSSAVLRAGRKKGFKLVMFESLDQTASRPKTALLVQKTITRIAKRLLPGLVNRMAWDVYRELDAMIYATSLEWETARYLFDARPDRGHVIGLGLREEALSALRQPAPEGDYLISIATITERKNTLRLAEAARRAQVPVLFLGKPYSENDEYYLRFKALVDGKFVRYPGYVTEDEKRRLIRSARGFVLLSQFESGCIAVYEAAAAGLPLLLSDLPWASKVYGHVADARFVPLGDDAGIAPALTGFYRSAHRLNRLIFPVPSWRDVASRYLAVYERILAGE